MDVVKALAVLKRKIFGAAGPVALVEEREGHIAIADESVEFRYLFRMNIAKVFRPSMLRPGGVQQTCAPEPQRPGSSVG